MLKHSRCSGSQISEETILEPNPRRSIQSNSRALWDAGRNLNLRPESIYFLGASWSGNGLSARLSGYHPNNAQVEQILCGDEHSVVARFGQQVGHVMTCVAQDLRCDLRFGDWKSTKEQQSGNSKVPDFAVVDSKGTARLIGEAKTPWNHSITTAMEEDVKLSGKFRRYLGESCLL